MPSPNNGQPAPPPGYKVDVSPPSGYVLDTPGYGDVPAFIQQGIDMSKVKQVYTPPSEDEAGRVTARVDESDPYTVKVLDPKWYDAGVLTHELTHTFQNTRNEKLNTSAPINHPGYGGVSDYQYGDVKGLQTARQAGKTISDFNAEQQAEMVMHYSEAQKRYMGMAAKGQLTDQDKRDWYEIQQTYHPFIKQLAEIPSQNENIDRNSLLELLGTQQPAPLNRHPEPPGLPSYDTPGLGVLPADPLMGGKSQPTGETQPHPVHPVLQQVLKENPGLAKNFNADNTSVVFADPKRSQRGLKERGGLEFWSPDDKGDPDFPHPSPGKHVLEIYSSDLKNNPQALKQAVYGDLMHGMSSDPYWNGLRTEFMQNFTPQEIKRQEQHQTWWNDVNGSKDKYGPTYDAYLRGWIANEGRGRQGQEKSGNTMYSPKQIQILQKMQDYLKTGKEPPKPTKK